LRRLARETERREYAVLRARKARAAGFGVVVIVAAVAVASLGVMSAGAKQASSTAALPRAQTLYMSGNQWSPNTDLNPAKNWDYVTGLVGLVYETPFRYDPLNDKFIPWLASGGKWTTPTTYTMAIRQGATWSDGTPLTTATSSTASTWRGFRRTRRTRSGATPG